MEFLAEAIAQIEDTAKAAHGVDVESYTVKDKAGTEFEFDVAFLPTGEGRIAAVNLLSMKNDALGVAERIRLSKAPGPDYRQGTSNLKSLASFVALTNRFKEPRSVIWADPDTRVMGTIFDYHAEGFASPAAWRRHSARYACPLSDEWRTWGAGEEQTFDQEEFAAFLDKNDANLSGSALPDGSPGPTAAQLISMANNLEAYSNSKAKRERDPNTHKLVISYSSESGLNGSVIPPRAFMLSIPVFQDADRIPIEIRLRVTVEDGKAFFHVMIHSAQDILRHVFREMGIYVGSATGLPVFQGEPERE